MRRADWRARLAAYLGTEARRPHVYGQSDCALFVAGAVEAVTGDDPAADWRGRYTTKAGGLRMIRRAGFASLEALLDAQLERLERIAQARPGDVAQVPTGDGQLAVGVVVGPAVRVRTPAGLGTVPLASAVAAWRVG